MDFGKILTRAWEITWRWKVLWILGFLAALGGGGGGGGGFGNSGYRFGNQNPNPSSRIPNFNMPSIPPALVGLVVGLACLAVLVGIALWVLSVIARGGLIAGVVQAEDERTVSLGRAWSVGQRRFWTLFGIDILVAIPILILVLLAIGGAVVTLIPAFSTTGSGGPNAGQGALIVGVVLCACLFICGIALVAAVLGQIRIYAERAAILEGMGWTAAFGRGWQVIREHLGPTLILWLIFLALGLVVGVVILIILSPLLIPIVAMTARGEANAGWLLALCGGGLIAIVITAVINSVVQVFTSASWTLAYRELTGAAPTRPAGGFGGPEAPVPPAPEPMAAPEMPETRGGEG